MDEGGWMQSGDGLMTVDPVDPGAVLSCCFWGCDGAVAQGGSLFWPVQIPTVATAFTLEGRNQCVP